MPPLPEVPKDKPESTKGLQTQVKDELCRLLGNNQSGRGLLDRLGSRYTETIVELTNRGLTELTQQAPSLAG